MNTLLVAMGFLETYGGIQAVERLLHNTLSVRARSLGTRHFTCSLRDTSEAVAASGMDFEMWGARGARLPLVRAAMRQLREVRPDVIVLSHVHLARMAPLLAMLDRGARRAVMAYGIEVWKRLEFTARLGASWATEFWSISQYTAMQLRARHGLGRIPVYLLPLALPEDAGTDSTVADGIPTLLSVCRLDNTERGKGVDATLRAHALLLREMPDLCYHIVGDGADVARLRQIAHQLRITHRVRFLGRLSRNELNQEYARCTVFVLPSRKEGFGIVYLEAMAARKPVVALRCGGTPEVVVDGECGILVEPDDLSGLYEALRFLLRDRQERRRLGENGRLRVATLFSPSAFRQRVNELLTGGAPGLPG